MSTNPPRLLGALVGDIYTSPSAKTKYGFLFNALAQHTSALTMVDATLSGPTRWATAALTFHPERLLWRERFYKNLTAFEWCSQKVAHFARTHRAELDLILQVGVLFDARWDDLPIPSVIYTDYTARLSALTSPWRDRLWSPSERERWYALEQHAYQRATFVCTRGQQVYDSVITDYAIDPAKVLSVGGGLNFAELPNLTQPATRHPPTALFIGKDFYRKGGDVLLRAFAQVRARLPQARLLLLTADPIPSGLSLDGVQPIVPTWDRAQIAALYTQSDVFVLPSRQETWGDVLLEAMAYGLPCIGVAGHAMGDIVVDQVTGLVVPSEDDAALAEALFQLLSDRALSQHWGQAGRRRVETQFLWPHVAARLAQTFTPALRQSSSAGHYAPGHL